ncbi:MAG: sodium-dependent transporter [Muribaculaceae bacterium]|nr:sodium-dependent transporter [Muribaculaceae bacterium]MDY6294547.1 sodium-dependent transporter [Bacteroidales bacterium]MDY6411929.1 sodium-dependent transporter [Bacteroidales bacterium]
MKQKRIGFATRMGAIAATVGSAVGLGNIWRFPYQAGENGGGAYILVYLICVLLLGIPIMMSEFVIGRSTHKSMKGAVEELTPGSPFKLFAYIGVLGGLLICGYYCVVCGWVIEYLWSSASGNLLGHTPEEYSNIFSTFVSSPWRCVMWTLLFLILNFLVLNRGVEKGIERIASFMMPLLFLLLIVFCVNSLLLPDSDEGMEFLFDVDFDDLGWKGVVDAMGQAFMSLSLGVTCLITYSSYFKDDSNLMKDAVTISGLDTLVAILAGIVIFPAVFSFGLEPNAGPKLIFEILPTIFQQMPGGTIWATLFFLLLFFASITSTISLSEIPITFMIDEYKISRGKAIAITAVLMTIIAVLSALSFSTLSDVKLLGRNLFDFLDFVGPNFFMLLGGLVTAIYVGWVLKKDVIHEQLTNGGMHRSRFVQPYIIFSLRYIAPVAIVIIFLYYVGII